MPNGELNKLDDSLTALALRILDVLGDRYPNAPEATGVCWAGRYGRQGGQRCKARPSRGLQSKHGEPGRDAPFRICSCLAACVVRSPTGEG